MIIWFRFTGTKFQPKITWENKISSWQGGIPAVKKRDPALPGWTFSQVIAGYNLRRIYKRDRTRQDFIPTNRDHVINHHLAKQSESTMKYLFDTAKLFGNGFKLKTLNKPKTKFYKGKLHTKSKTLTRFWRKSIGLSHIWVQLFHPGGAFTSVRKTISHRIFLYKIIFFNFTSFFSFFLKQKNIRTKTSITLNIKSENLARFICEWVPFFSRKIN